MGYSWLTVHRVRFKQARDANETGRPPGPAGASAWRFGPHAPLDERGLRSGIADEWGGIGFYPDRAAAEAVIADPPAHLGFLKDTSEDWHALACVISHRGEEDWSTASEPSPGMDPVGDDPGGTLAVVTTAGYLPREDGTMDPRVLPFLRKVHTVVDHYRSLDENLASCLFNAVDWKFGMTFTIWKSDRGMMASAYREGTHAEYLKQHNAKPMFDFSSFTRLRLLSSAGTWDGADPARA